MILTLIIKSPLWICVDLACAAIFYISIRGYKSIKTLAYLALAFIAISAINPLFNTAGNSILFSYFGDRPYTLESLYLGMSTAAMFVTLMLWFSCFNLVLDSEKLINLFAPIAPKSSIVTMMILRFVPLFKIKATEIAHAQAAIGNSVFKGTFSQRAHTGASILRTLATETIEQSVITADSMYGKGFGLKAASQPAQSDINASFDINNLTFTYAGSSLPAIKNLSLKIEKGSYTCICGASGSGKTTLMRLLKSAISPAGTIEGEILLGGMRLSEIDDAKQASEIGFVFDSPDAQIVCESVSQEMKFGLKNLGIAPEEMQARISEMASFMGINNWFSKSISELSGGQKQLLNLATNMLAYPSVLILDEPTAELDPISATEFLNMVKRINAQLGITVIIAEHRLEEFYADVDNVVVLKEGSVAALGRPREVAKYLFKTQDKMQIALPSPSKIYESVCAGTSGNEAPLTIREGIKWLQDYVGDASGKQDCTGDASGEQDCAGDASGKQDCAGDASGKQDCAEYAKDNHTEAALSIKNIYFRYDRQSPDILSGLNLEIKRSSITAIVGANGSGKTTLLKAICGIIKPQRGTIKILSQKRDNKLISEPAMTVSLLPQNPAYLFSESTIYDDFKAHILSASSDYSSCDNHDIKIMEVAKLCEIESLLSRYPLDLSRGELGRVALAKVLLTKPQILLLDEPTKGIDALFKVKMISVLQSLAAKGISIVIVSHDVEFCAKVADTVAMLFDGRFSSISSSKSFFSTNFFYTTAASKMSRSVFLDTITDEEVIEACQKLK